MSSCIAPWTLATFFLAPQLASNQCLAVLHSPHQFTSCSAVYYISAFAMTCLIEALVYLPSHRRTANTMTKQLRLAIIPNLATHPFIYFGIPAIVTLAHGYYGQTLLYGEIFAPACEAILLWKFWGDSPSKSVLVAVSANLFSWTVGALLGM